MKIVYHLKSLQYVHHKSWSVLHSHKSDEQNAGVHWLDDWGTGDDCPTAGMYSVASGSTGTQEGGVTTQAHSSGVGHHKARGHHQHERPQDEYVYTNHKQRPLKDPWESQGKGWCQGEQHLWSHGSRRGVRRQRELVRVPRAVQAPAVHQARVRLFAQ